LYASNARIDTIFTDVIIGQGGTLKLSVIDSGYISLFPVGTAGLRVDKNGNVILTDTLRILDPAGNDSALIYDDGDTTRFESTNPIKIGTGSVIINEDNTVLINDTLFVPIINHAGDLLYIRGILDADTIRGLDTLSSALIQASIFQTDPTSRDSIIHTIGSIRGSDLAILGNWDFSAADSTIFSKLTADTIFVADSFKVGHTVTINGNAIFIDGTNILSMVSDSIGLTLFLTDIDDSLSNDHIIAGNWDFTTTDSTKFKKLTADTGYFADSLKVGHTVSINGNAIYISGTDILDMVLDSIKNTYSDSAQALNIHYEASPDSELIFNSGRGENNIAGGIDIVNIFFSTDAIWDSLGLHSEGIDSTRCKVYIESNVRRNGSTWIMEDVVTGHVDSANAQYYSAYIFWIPPKDFASFDSISTVNLFAETGADVDLIIYRNQTLDSLDVGTITTTHDAYFDKELSSANIGTLNLWDCYRFDKFIFQYTVAVTNTAEARLGRLKIVYNKR